MVAAASKKETWQALRWGRPAGVRRGKGQEEPMVEPQRQPWAEAGPHLQRRDLVGVRPGAGVRSGGLDVGLAEGRPYSCWMPLRSSGLRLSG